MTWGNEHHTHPEADAAHGLVTISDACPPQHHCRMYLTSGYGGLRTHKTPHFNNASHCAACCPQLTGLQPVKTVHHDSGHSCAISAPWWQSEGCTLPSSMTRLKKVPVVKSCRAEVAARWCSRYLGASSTRGFWKGRFSCLLRAWKSCAGVVTFTTNMLASLSAWRRMCCTITRSHTSCKGHKQHRANHVHVESGMLS